MELRFEKTVYFNFKILKKQFFKHIITNNRAKKGEKTVNKHFRGAVCNFQLFSAFSSSRKCFGKHALYIL